MQLLLGSNSPRRNELLAQMGYEFTKVVINCDESIDEGLKPEDVAEYLAIKKSSEYSGLTKTQVLLTADTVVICDSKILNKPRNYNEAFEMLNLLSNKDHKVITGVCLKSNNKTISFSEVTEIAVDALTKKEIEYYLKNYKPFDKAGSYGIQEWFGICKISSIKGDYYNAVGLPCNALFKRLNKDFKVNVS